MAHVLSNGAPKRLPAITPVPVTLHGIMGMRDASGALLGAVGGGGGLDGRAEEVSESCLKEDPLFMDSVCSHSTRHYLMILC